ncbi:hypothetical protein NDU88_002563 [Pleurodeles waltl]|uniref:Uncharacterized protein n=1 Tax=Pleurodeles waltl TaxID=8319 RepID=A0AAV7WLK1_PLEWA|nr:hypothetical protein NDU88_002563 [Pleurodeles waltl]
MHRFHSRVRPSVVSPLVRSASIDPSLRRRVMCASGQHSQVQVGPAVFASEIQSHDDPKTTQCGLRSHQPPSVMLCIVSPVAGTDLPVVLQASVDFQARSWRLVNFSPADRRCVNLFPPLQLVRGFLTLVLPASPFRAPGTGWAPLGRVGFSAGAPGAGREKSLLSLRLQITGGKL